MNKRRFFIQGKPVPGWLRAFCYDFLAFVVCMRSFVVNERQRNKTNSVSVDEKVASLHHSEQNGALNTDILKTEKPDKIDKVIDILVDFKDTMSKQYTQECIIREWTVIAMLFDRLFLYIFTTITILMTITIMFGDKHNDGNFVPP